MTISRMRPHLPLDILLMPHACPPAHLRAVLTADERETGAWDPHHGVGSGSCQVPGAFCHRGLC